MAKPQLEKGYTKVANEILENIVKINLSAYENRILWSIIRLTYGWNKKSARISLTTLSNLTNLPTKKVSVLLKKLEFKLLIIIERKRKGFIISFQKDYDVWRKATQINYSKADPAILASKRCAICKGQNNLQRHHILPKEWGGSDAKQNKVLLCRLGHDRVHIWLKYTKFKNGQDLYNKFWDELNHPLFGGPFNLDLSPEQVSKLSLIEVKKISPIEGTIKYIKERKKKDFLSSQLKKEIKDRDSWLQCQECGMRYPPIHKTCPSCQKRAKPLTEKQFQARKQKLLEGLRS